MQQAGETESMSKYSFMYLYVYTLEEKSIDPIDAHLWNEEENVCGLIAI